MELYKYLQLRGKKSNFIKCLLCAEHCLMCTDRCEDDYNLLKKKKKPQHQKSLLNRECMSVMQHARTWAKWEYGWGGREDWADPICGNTVLVMSWTWTSQLLLTKLEYEWVFLYGVGALQRMWLLTKSSTPVMERQKIREGEVVCKSLVSMVAIPNLYPIL